MEPCNKGCLIGIIVLEPFFNKRLYKLDLTYFVKFTKGSTKPFLRQDTKIESG